MRCTLQGEGSRAFVIEKSSDGFTFIFMNEGETFSYASDDQFGTELFIQDLAACCTAIGNLNDRLAIEVSVPLADRTYTNDVDSPLALEHESLRVLMFFKPKSYDKLPVTVQIFLRGYGWMTLRVRQDELRLLVQQMIELISEAS